MNAKPKALIHADAVATIEQRIVDALPEIIEKIISRAKEGDLKAALYLCDRVMGRAAGASAPLADDRHLPFTNADFEEAVADAEERRALLGALFRSGARNGA